jgi:hypothetical protein
MSTTDNTPDASVEAAHGSKMLRVSVRFWTDEIADTSGHVVPGHAWASGVVVVESNETHGIRREQKGETFNSMAELPLAIEKAIMRAGITLHSRGRESRYRADARHAE